ncbi:tRNA lysidine(34) synthetase TilS [Marinobacterium rhizophilum]|uniref:tRNA(Ile)-lysidine synthase n=1 Tax=Marinobacterium rhizophilum TaxID=420402 RepID=A0ABY5HEL4_9GAMM|nr:tRNA lysidine(34) synthetase TilS [Marinobacterium rhizophilum]UTW10286.1 tRNA lysidine(34) synthetase TilS [Marinobacterium rhizophilum]
MPADALQREFERQLAGVTDVRRWLIGYSGGLDSRVLAELAARVLDPSRLLLLHVNHHLQSESDAWAAHAVEQAAALGVAIRVLDVAPTSASEADARQARYAAFMAELGAGDLLLLGHHADDQAETLLLRLMRGAGARGLAGMPRQRALGEARLLRPLLGVSRLELSDWARHQGLDWVNDPSNSALEYDRNFVRHRVLAPLMQRWPDAPARMGLSAGLLDETAGLLEELARADLKACLNDRAGLAGGLLGQLSAARQRNLLRYWLGARTGVTVNGPLLERIEQELLQAGSDRQPQLQLGEHALRRYRGDLYVQAPLKVTPSAVLARVALAPGEIALQQGLLSISAVNTVSRPALRTLEGLGLRYRREGERCRPAGRSGSHPLKKLFQEYGVLPWQRNAWPLLVCGDEIVAAPGLWVCEGWQARPAEDGYVLGWCPG